MASEPSDGSESNFLTERRRWGDGSNVYTRRFYKAQRNNKKNNSATSVANSNESSSVFDPQTFAAENGVSLQHDLQEPEVVLSKDIERVGQEEGATGDGSTEEGTGEEVVPPESREVVVVSESREELVPPENGELGVASESREVVVAAGGSEEVVVPGNREMVPESSEAVVAVASRELVPPESREMVPESSEAAVLPDGSEAAVQSSEAVVLPESSEAVVLPESSEAVVLPQSGEAVMLSESSEAPMLPVMSPESREVVMLRGSREAMVTLESRGAVLPPQASGNGAVEANGVVRTQQQLQMELQPMQPVTTRVEDRVRINISGARSADEIKELRWELETELDQVRSLFKKLEAKELQLTAYNRSNLPSNMNGNVGMVNGINNNNVVSNFGVGGGDNFGGYSQPQRVRNDFVDRRGLTRVNSEAGSISNQEARLYSRSLSVSVVENNHNHGVGEFVEREKRTPKANQFYRNSEFLLGKDRLPPESNKKLKSNGAGRKHGGEGEHGFGFGYDKLQRERVFRSCSSLLQRLMKHKFGWVFNVPVDAKKLGLHDYHDIIRHPMDLGTIKTRLSQNYYKSPKEFADDVRLVFHNAMTYNPKGQDVHVMAETLLQIFEERWSVIQTEHNPDWRYQMYRDAGLPTPTSRKAPPTQQFYTPAPIPIPITPVPQMRTLDRSESMTTPVDPNLKLSSFAHVGRTPVPKKPKAKDPNKRDMTYEEKQKLGTNLQSLPSEKLDAIVQIIKKRNSTLNQHDDEIEVDIDSVDAETLWELDRFVTNYKKNLSKNKRKAEIALQARDVAAQTFPVTNTATAVVDAQKESRIAENNAPPPVQVEKQGDNASRSSSSSSSSSDSGSSSSDSDSDSSSGYGSDAGRSPAA